MPREWLKAKLTNGFHTPQQNPLLLTPHRSAELLFEQKEERFVYIIDILQYSNTKKKLGAPL